MKKVVTFGEVLMRLATPGHATLAQTNTLDVHFGGGEANVAISLAYMSGIQSYHVTSFPENAIGNAATQHLRKHWVHDDFIKYQGEKIGLYFLEKGAIHRPSFVWYDRRHSSFGSIHEGSFDWEHILDGASWFHCTGITPAISRGAFDNCMQAFEIAQKKGVKVSFDAGFRQNMWQYGISPEEGLKALSAKSDVLIGGSSIMKFLLGIDENQDLGFEALCQKTIREFPNIQYIADKKRHSVSASHHQIKGKLYDGKRLTKSDTYEITPIVDRVGAGDAFAAGLIYGFLNYSASKDVIEYASSACALKHTIEGDANMVSSEVVKQLMQGDTSGDLKR